MKTSNIQHSTFNAEHRTGNAGAVPGAPPADLVLKVTLTPGEFEMVRWANRVCARSRKARRAVGIAAFARGALLDAVGQAITEVLARPGGFIPPQIAVEWEAALEGEKHSTTNSDKSRAGIQRSTSNETKTKKN